MKNSKRIVVTLALAVALALSALLPGCSSSVSSPPSAPSSWAASAAPAPAPRELMSTGEGNDMAMQMEAGDSVADTGGFSNNSLSSIKQESVAPAATEQPRKLVKNSDLQLETKEFDNAITSLLKLFEESGGYVDSQSVDGKSLRRQGDYYERNAYIVARVPADKLDSVTSQIGKLCNITSQSQSVMDITDSYYDAQARLEVLKVKEKRLIELLEKAEKLEDIIELENALSNCQYEMDSLNGQLKRMDNYVSYSTLNINLAEVVEYSDVVAPPATFGQKLVDSAQRSGRNFLRSLQNILLGIIELGPVTILYLAFWGSVIYLVYRIFFRKRRLARKAARDMHISDRPVQPFEQPAQSNDAEPDSNPE